MDHLWDHCVQLGSRAGPWALQFTSSVVLDKSWPLVAWTSLVVNGNYSFPMFTGHAQCLGTLLILSPCRGFWQTFKCESNTGCFFLSLARILGLHPVFLDYFLQAVSERSSRMKWSTNSWFWVLCLPNKLWGLYLAWNSVCGRNFPPTIFTWVTVKGLCRPPGNPTIRSLGVCSMTLEGLIEYMPLRMLLWTPWLGGEFVVFVQGWCLSLIQPSLGRILCLCFWF